MQIKITVSLPIEVSEKSRWYVACCRALDVASQGDTPEAAKSHLEEALIVFLESCLARGVLEEVLQECGFTPSVDPGADPAHEKRDTVDIPLYLFAKPLDSDHYRLA